MYIVQKGLNGFREASLSSILGGKLTVNSPKTGHHFILDRCASLLKTTNL
jgi:hypothetical protein